MNNKTKFIFFLVSVLLISAIFIPQKSLALENLFSVDANTVALWRFNEVSGSTVIDSTGINNGSAIGTTIVDGKFGKARYFNGVSDYIVVPDNPSLRNLSQITIEAWVYPTGFDLGCWANAEDIVSKGFDSNYGYTDGYALRINRNQEGWCAAASSFNQLRFSASLAGAGISGSLWHEPNQWYYVVFTYDGSYLKLYVNGNLEGVSNYVPNLSAPTTQLLYINHHGWVGNPQGSQRMQGQIDEIRISNIARSAGEIAYYYNLATGQLSPILSNLNQFKSDGLTPILESTTTTENTIIFKAVLNDLNQDQVKLQVELKKFDQSFDGQNFLESSFVSSGSEVAIIKENLDNGKYHWRARAMDDKGNTSQWQEFGQSGNVDFTIRMGKIFPDEAIALIKEVVGAPYLGNGKNWGGKGFDCQTRKFADPIGIKTSGYYFYDGRIEGGACSGEKRIGVDCSGLNFWSYNRAYYGEAWISGKEYRINLPLFYEGAAGQYRDNTERINKEDLKPGDLLFFDTDNNGFMDHTAMYVGEIDTYNVIHASFFTKTITIAKYNPDTEKLLTLKPNGETQFLKVTGYGRVIDPKINLRIIAHSPINLIVADPEGFITSLENPWEGPMEYRIYDIDEDGELDDVVITGERKIGDYLISVVPKPNVLPTDTYTLEVEAFINGESKIVVLAKDVFISEIPTRPYIIRVAETDVIPIILTFIDFDPDTLNLKNRGKWVTTYIELPTGYNPKDIDLGSIRLNNQIPIEPKPIEIGDYNKNEIPDLMVKFNRSAIQNILTTGDQVKVTISGKLNNGRLFEGSDIIRVKE